MACKTMAQIGGQIPLARRVLLAQELTSVDVYPGAIVKPDFTQLAGQITAGRQALVTALYIEMDAVIDCSGNTRDMSSHWLRSVYTLLSISGCDGHRYFDQLDGRDVVDDAWMRGCNLLNTSKLSTDWNPAVANPFTASQQVYPVGDQIAPFGIPSTETGAAIRRCVDLRIPLRSGRGLNGAIPLEDLDTVSGQLQFTLRTTIPGGDNLPISSFECESSVRCRIWVEIEERVMAVTPRRYTVLDYTLPLITPTIPNPRAMHRYLAARFHEDDLAAGTGLTLADLLGANVQYTAAGQLVWSGATKQQTDLRQYEILRNERESEYNLFDRSISLPAFSIVPGPAKSDGGSPYGGQTAVKLIEQILPWTRQASDAPIGVVALQFPPSAIATPPGYIRYLHRIESTSDEAELATSIAASKGHDTPEVVTDVAGDRVLTSMRRNKR